MKKILTFPLCILMVFTFSACAQLKAPKDNQHVEIGGKALSQWKKELNPLVYKVLFKAGTERPYTGALLRNKKKGIYVSAACKQPVFSSEHKFDSGTGWPSFTQPVNEEAVKLVSDYKLGYERIEVVSAQCGEHLGHVFNDGPAPTGKRYCINSAALDFVEEGR